MLFGRSKKHLSFHLDSFETIPQTAVLPIQGVPEV